jgi:hypothetical protein
MKTAFETSFKRQNVYLVRFKLKLNFVVFISAEIVDLKLKQALKALENKLFFFVVYAF